MKKKKNIILDLDMTVIYSTFLRKKDAEEEGDRQYDIEKNKEKAIKFNFHNMEGVFVIFERPGLQKFLDFLFENFNVSVWTAASQDYATFIAKNIILGGRKERTLDHFMFYYHGEKVNEMYNGTSKNLKMLWECYGLEGYNKENTMILDDNEDVYDTQRENCLIAKEFSYYDEGSENDDFLQRVEGLLREYVLKDTSLSLAEAVRLINDALKNKKN